jgi:predicted Zn-dependent peptidase
LVTPDELAAVARILVSERLKSRDTSWSRAESLALNTLYDLGYDYDDQFPSKLASVTPEQIFKAAQHYLDPDRCVVVKILPQESEGKKE